MWTRVEKTFNNSNQSDVTFLHYHQLVVMSLSFKVFVLFCAQTLYLVNQRLKKSKIKFENILFGLNFFFVLPQSVRKDDNKEEKIAKSFFLLSNFSFRVLVVSEMIEISINTINRFL